MIDVAWMSLDCRFNMQAHHEQMFFNVMQIFAALAPWVGVRCCFSAVYPHGLKDDEQPWQIYSYSLSECDTECMWWTYVQFNK